MFLCDKKEALVLSELNLKSLEALKLRETFQKIYHAPTQEQFEHLLNEWHSWAIASELSSMEKVAKRKARGYKAKHFKTIIYLITGGLNFTRANLFDMENHKFDKFFL